MLRKIIEINEELCNGCGQCVPDCAEGSLIIENGKARLVADKLCDGLGACLGSCPQGALKIVEKETDEFDEEAVEAFLSDKGKPQSATKSCPSAAPQVFAPPFHSPATRDPLSDAPLDSDSLLGQWPVQIRLIPPTAPFLRNSDILVVADCSAVAIADFQRKYMVDKVVMMGCPKFDDREEYVSRFTAIFKTAHVRSITLLLLEVPCCSGMSGILKKAIEQAAAKIPVQQITISRQGQELSSIAW